MLNARLVNARISYFPPATFCESFAVFGRIPRFQNPFKYTRNFQINQSRGLAAGAQIFHYNQWPTRTCMHLTKRKGSVLYLHKIEKAARNRRKAAEMG